jgi:PAS domain S-box-containing protein
MTQNEAGKAFSTFDYYQALFENPKKNSVLLLDEDGSILQVNRAFLLSFGYDEEDLLGEHFAMLFTEEDRMKELPMREIRTVMDEGQSFDNNYLVNKNGARTWASGESVLVKNAQGRKCVLKVIQNIHTQKESELSIIRLNSFNENILSSIEDAVLVLDQEKKIVKANRAFLRLFDLPEAHLHNVDFEGLLQTFDRREELEAAIANTLAGTVPSLPMHIELKDGEGVEKYFEVSVLRLESLLGQTNALLIFHDVTTQKSQDRQREDILNFVAHELRNPLTNIMLNIDWMDQLCREKGVDGLSDFIIRTKRNSERLKKLVNELYKSTKLISGNYDLQGEVFAFDELVEETVQGIRLEHPAYHIELRGKAEVTLSADKDKLMQVLTNYLTNAVKYSGGNTDIVVSVFVRDGSIVVAVTDRGKGIPAKELPFVFNRFYRAEKTRNLEGLGIGLFLSRQIVEAHQGRVWAESSEGQGSTFYFSLPSKGNEGGDGAIYQ